MDEYFDILIWSVNGFDLYLLKNKRQLQSLLPCGSKGLFRSETLCLYPLLLILLLISDLASSTRMIPKTTVHAANNIYIYIGPSCSTIRDEAHVEEIDKTSRQCHHSIPSTMNWPLIRQTRKLGIVSINNYALTLRLLNDAKETWIV